MLLSPYRDPWTGRGSTKETPEGDVDYVEERGGLGMHNAPTRIRAPYGATRKISERCVQDQLKRAEAVRRPSSGIPRPARLQLPSALQAGDNDLLTGQIHPSPTTEQPMKVSIPFLSRGKERETFLRTVDNAAGHANISSERFLIALTYWYEEVANEVCVGNPVPLLGFGKIAPVLEERKAKCNRYNQGFPYSIPQFVASPGFRAQVKLMAPCSTRGKKSLNCYRRNRPGPNGKTLVHTTGAKIREDITRQLSV